MLTRHLWFCGLLTVSAGLLYGGDGSGEVAVAIRYLQATGTSHAHVYLYREDGELLRQLTKEETGQDGNPVFAPDGETIVLTRELPKGEKQWWSIRPRGGDLHQLETAPEWYAQAKKSPSYFYQAEEDPARIPEPKAPLPLQRRCRTPDGKSEVIISPAGGTEQEAPDRWEVRLHNLATGKTASMGVVPGYSAELLSMGQERFLQEGDLDVLFCSTHLNSTDGDIVHALDLRARRLVRLSQNWAAPFPLSGQAAFLSVAEERYVPFGNGQKTANCSYLDRWDAGWKRVRYARAGTAAIFYGGSMYRPGKSPVIITTRQDP